jgi:excisionase family DNA binding protein
MSELRYGVPMFGDDRQEKPKDGEQGAIPYRELYPIKEAAILLGISESKTYRLADSGELPTVWNGGNRQVKRGELMAYVAGLPAAQTRKRPKRKPVSALASAA